MSWEREHHHINLDESEHVISLIERGVITRNGEPARYLIHIKMGGEHFEHLVGANWVKIHLGADLTPQPNGLLKSLTTGQVFDPKAFEAQMIEQLNRHHAAMRAYAKKHGAPEYKGPKAR